MNMLVRSSAAAVVTAAAVTYPAQATPTSSQPSNQTTTIDRLWEQRKAIKHELATASRRYHRLEAELLRRMPKPHSSITYSKENDADGLQFIVPNCDPHTLNSYIWSSDITQAIAMIDESCATYARVGSKLVLYPDTQRPVNKRDSARRKRLAARLELSLEYEKMKDKIDREIGLSKLNKKIEDKILPRLTTIETRIYSAPAVTQSDLNRKLVIYEADTRCEYTAARLLRDFRRLVKQTASPIAA